MKIRIIKSSDCEKCKSYFNKLDKFGFTEYDIYDADEPKNQKQLDEWNIEEMPVIQVYDPSTDKVYYTFPYCERGYSPRSLKYRVTVCEEAKK